MKISNSVKYTVNHTNINLYRQKLASTHNHTQTYTHNTQHKHTNLKRITQHKPTHSKLNTQHKLTHLKIRAPPHTHTHKHNYNLLYLPSRPPPPHNPPVTHLPTYQLYMYWHSQSRARTYYSICVLFCTRGRDGVRRGDAANQVSAVRSGSRLERKNKQTAWGRYR